MAALTVSRCGKARWQWADERDHSAQAGQYERLVERPVERLRQPMEPLVVAIGIHRCVLFGGEKVNEEIDGLLGGARVLRPERSPDAG